MKNPSHWKPRYIYSKLVLSLYEQQHPDHPWLTSSAISILSTYLKESDVGLEWGSGRSTAWFAKKIKHLVSVESNPKWHQKVSANLQDSNLDNVDYRLVIDEKNYVDLAETFSENSLDFVLVDGSPSSRRSSCATKAVDKIKVGGCIVVDNANWFLPCNSHSPNSRTYETGPASEEWQHFIELIKDWRTIWTSNGVTDTALFFKLTS